MPLGRLEVTDALGRRVVPLEKPTFSIGRRSGNDLQLVGSDVSRDHADIAREEEQLHAPGPRLAVRHVRQRRADHGEVADARRPGPSWPQRRGGDGVPARRAAALELVDREAPEFGRRRPSSDCRPAGGPAGARLRTRARRGARAGHGLGHRGHRRRARLHHARERRRASSSSRLPAPAGASRCPARASRPAGRFPRRSSRPVRSASSRTCSTATWCPSTTAPSCSASATCCARRCASSATSIAPTCRTRKSASACCTSIAGRRAPCSRAPRARALDTLATEAAVAIENARLYRETLDKAKMEQEMRIAADIQRALLPGSASGWAASSRRWAPRCHAGRSAATSSTTSTCRMAEFGFAVGDVAGKGAPAALLTAVLQGVFASQASSGTGPAMTLSRVNQALIRRSVESRFATAFYAVLTPDGKLTYCNAGHNPPLLIRHGRRRAPRDRRADPRTVRARHVRGRNGATCRRATSS